MTLDPNDPVDNFIMLLMLAADPRTCLVIGEIVKDGKRTEIARKRSKDMLTVNEDVLYVLKQVALIPPALGNPDEIVIRILRPQAE